MGMLRMFRPSRLEQEKSGHPKLSHHVATDLSLRKSQDNTLTESLDGLQAGTSIPRHGAVSFSNDIRPSDPHITQSCSKETRTDLLSDDFSFWKLRHNSSRLRAREELHYAMRSEERQDGTEGSGKINAEGRQNYAARRSWR